jgi:hypothetical protein
MRCMACGAEMMLMNVDRDDSMGVLGCEHHTLKCSECQDVKWHLAFIRHNRASPRLPVQAAPPVVPASTNQDARPGLFRRSAAKIRRWAAKCGALGLRAASQLAKLVKFCPAIALLPSRSRHAMMVLLRQTNWGVSMSSTLSSLQSNSVQRAPGNSAVGTTVRARGSCVEWQPPARKPVRVGRVLARFLITVVIGVVATLAWQSYGDAAREMIASFLPRLGWLAQPAAHVAEAVASVASPDQEELKAISLGLADVRQRVDKIADQIGAGQEQMTREITSKLQAAEQDILEKLSTPGQRSVATAARKPVLLTQPPETQPLR